ncbi:MAG: hypothetical protein RR645_06195 [Clostridium sp.]
MVKLYVRKINKGEITLREVPLYWRDKVEQELKNQQEIVYR